MKICPREATQRPGDKFSHRPELTVRANSWLHLLSLILALCSYGTSSSLSAANSLAPSDSVFRFQSKMAQRGHVASQYALAYMYESGQGADRDLTLATDWYRQAARQGFVPAKDRLVYIDILNNGYQQQKQQQWLLGLKQTADHYNHKHQGESAFLLGQLYAAGLGVNKSLTMALKYLHLAEATNVIGSDSEIGRVETELYALREAYTSTDQQTSQHTQQTSKSSGDNKTTDTVKKQLTAVKPAEAKAPGPAAKKSSQPVSNRTEPVPPRPAGQHTPATSAAAAKASQTAPTIERSQASLVAGQNNTAEQQERHPMQIICSGWQRTSSACR